jgi:hypothetical protein
MPQQSRHSSPRKKTEESFESNHVLAELPFLLFVAALALAHRTILLPPAHRNVSAQRHA